MTLDEILSLFHIPDNQPREEIEQFITPDMIPYLTKVHELIQKYFESLKTSMFIHHDPELSNYNTLVIMIDTSCMPLDDAIETYEKLESELVSFELENNYNFKIDVTIT